MNLRNKEQNPPEKFFEGSQLVCAQKIFDNNIQELKNILEKNPELLNKLSDKKGYTLLMYSSILENLEAMKLLLKKGADPNIIIPYLNNSPLSQAVASNNYQMLNLLLKYKTSLNPSVGKSPLVVALMIEGEDNEKKMIDYLLKNCANINHSSYLGHNIMESAARDHIETAKIFIKKGGNPIIRNTKISPIAEFMTWKEKEISKHKSINEKYKNKFFSLKKILQNQFNISFPYKNNPKEEAKFRVRLYENLSEKDKRSVNFLDNYGEKRYQEDLKIISL